MAEKVLKIKSVSEVAEAISGLKDLDGSLRGVGTAAIEASGKSKGEWKALEEQWKSSTEAAKGIADQAFKTEAALNAMGRATSVSKIEAELIRAKVEFTKLQDKIREVAATGGTIDDGVVAAMNVMRSAIDAGKAKLEDLRGSAERAKRELGLTGKAGEEAAGGIRKTGDAAGTAAGKLGQIGETLKKQTEGFNKFRGAALEAWGALSLGEQIGNAVAGAIDYLAEKQALADLQTQAAAERQITLEAALRAVDRGWIQAGKTQDETIARYVRMTTALGRLDAQSRLYIATTAGMKAPAAWAEMEKRADAMEQALTGAYKRSEEEGHRWALANAGAIKAVLAEFDRVGKEAPEALRAYLAQAEAWAAANEKAAASARALGSDAAAAVSGVGALGKALEGVGKGDTSASIEAVAAAIARLRERGADSAGVVADNTAALAALYREASKSYETLEKFRNEVLASIPAVQAAAIVDEAYAEASQKISEAYLARQKAHEDEIRRINEEELALAALKDRAVEMASAVDTIGEAWEKATGQAAGFTVEVRRAREEIETADPRWTSFIDQLAGVSDEFERMVPWIGAMLAEVERGDMPLEEFLKKLGEIRAGFMQIQGMSGHMFGDLETEMNRLTKIINDFIGANRFSDDPTRRPPKGRK